jgi:hypothetical protein
VRNLIFLIGLLVCRCILKSLKGLISVKCYESGANGNSCLGETMMVLSVKNSNGSILKQTNQFVGNFYPKTKM